MSLGATSMRDASTLTAFGFTLISIGSTLISVFSTCQENMTANLVLDFVVIVEPPISEGGTSNRRLKIGDSVRILKSRTCSLIRQWKLRDASCHFFQGF